MYNGVNGVGNLVWQADLDIFGKVHTLGKGNINDCPFRYQGQYDDAETGLYYNRFRYYSPESGMYISQDPIRLEGGNPNIYAYVSDTNTLVDSFGLETIPLPNSGTAYLLRFTDPIEHYKVATPDGNVYDLSTGRGTTIEIRKKGPFSEVLTEGMDNVAEISINEFSTKKGKTIEDAANSIKNNYHGKTYIPQDKPKSNDCFDYAIKLLRKLGANINPMGDDNFDKFDSLCKR